MSGSISFISRVVLLFAFVSLALAHNQLLPAYGKQCFHEKLKKGDELAVTFQVGTRNPSQAEQPVADFWIVDPNGNRLVNLVGVPDGHERIDIQQPGKYEYCFSNEKSGDNAIDVSFHVHGVVYVDTENIAPGGLEAEIKILSRLVEDVKNEQSYIVIRERTHRNTAESTNARVKWWSIFQLLVVAANSLFQIVFLRRFFEVKSNV